MNFDEQVVANIVKQVLDRVDLGGSEPGCAAAGGDWGVFASMNDAVEAAAAAQRQYLNCSMHDRAKYVQAIRNVVLEEENLDYISRLAVEETGMGAYEYKLV